MKVKYKIILFGPVAIVLFTLIKMLLPVPANNKAFEEYCWITKTYNSEHFNIVIMGDSRMYKGVSPAILTEGKVNTTAYNFGYSSGGYSEEYLSFVSERIKKNENRIAVCGITPYSFTPDALRNEHYHSFYNRDEKEVYKILFLSKFMKYFPIYSPSQIRDYISPDSIQYVYSHVYNENGWVKSHKLPFDSTYALPAYRENFIDNTTSKEAVDNYLDWVKEKASEGVKVVGYRPPSTFAMEQLEDSLSGFDYTDFVSRFKANGGYWFTYSLMDYKSYDGSHLHFESAEKFSKNLKEDLENLP